MFNDYFQAPPPAALEFLEKIREVIHEAKRKLTMKKFTPNLIVIPEDINECMDESSSSCNNCKTHFKIKSATIHKWLMDVPSEVTKPKKTQAPCTPVDVQEEKDVNKIIRNDDVGERPEKNALKPNAGQDEDDVEDEEESSINIECDSLERSMNYRQKMCGYHTPSEYGDTRQDLSPVLSNSALPLEEEMTVRTTYTYDTITKRENYYEHISGPDCVREKPCKRETLPDILNRTSERQYSLVSEVYVNDNFNANSSMSPNNTLDKKIRKKSPGQITIEVEDCPDNHPVEDSDSFEPDTLDRICTKDKPRLRTTYSSDSLEQYSSPKCLQAINGYGGVGGSLMEIYEAKNVMADVQKRWHASSATADGDMHYLTPDLKHRRRQRCPSPPAAAAAKPTKNACVRSTSEHGAVQRLDCVGGVRDRQTHDITAGASDKRAVKCLPIDHSRYEDSGYLSTESNESFGRVMATGRDTDESGAESIDTDFKFFKTPTDRNYCDW